MEGARAAAGRIIACTGSGIPPLPTMQENSAMTTSTAFRTLALAAAMTGSVLAGAARADVGAPSYGPSASPAWSATDARAPLAGPDAPAQGSLERSGATGGGGQHA